jgi:hypothetical protein
VPHRIFRPKVERPKVHGVVGVVITPMECDAEKTPLEHIAAADLQFDRALSELAAVDPRDAVPILDS